MSDPLPDPSELNLQICNIAGHLLTEQLPKGERIQDLVEEIGPEEQDYGSGFMDALIWIKESVLPLTAKQGCVCSTKTERRGVAKQNLLLGSIMDQSCIALSQIIDDDDDDGPSVIIPDLVAPEISEVDEDGLIRDRHVFVSGEKRVVIEVYRSDTMATILAPRIITTFGDSLDEATKFSKWLIDVSASYQAQGLRLVYVEASPQTVN